MLSNFINYLYHIVHVHIIFPARSLYFLPVRLFLSVSSFSKIPVHPRDFYVQNGEKETGYHFFFFFYFASLRFLLLIPVPAIQQQTRSFFLVSTLLWFILLPGFSFDWSFAERKRSKCKCGPLKRFHTKENLSRSQNYKFSKLETFNFANFRN